MMRGGEGYLSGRFFCTFKILNHVNILTIPKINIFKIKNRKFSFKKLIKMEGIEETLPKGWCTRINGTQNEEYLVEGR